MSGLTGLAKIDAVLPAFQNLSSEFEPKEFSK